MEMGAPHQPTHPPHPLPAVQVGATPEGTEKPRLLRDPSLAELAASLAPQDAPTIPTGADVKVSDSEERHRTLAALGCGS